VAYQLILVSLVSILAEGLNSLDSRSQALAKILCYFFSISSYTCFCLLAQSFVVHLYRWPEAWPASRKNSEK